MYCIACPPVLQLFDRPAEIADQWAIDGFEFAARGHDRNESGYPVNCCAELRFALPQRLFRPLAVCQIEHECKALVASFFEQSGATAPVALSSAARRSSASRHSGGVSSFQLMRPERRSRRSYPTRRRKASFASVIEPSRS